MLKLIAETSTDLLDFIEHLDMPLSKPQQRHLLQIADALITTEGRKDLSNLYRHIVGDPCPKSAADTFREAPWPAEQVRTPLRTHLVKTAFELAAAEGAPRQVFLSLDDSLTVKDKHSHKLECVDWHFNHTQATVNQPAYTKGMVYVMLRLTVGSLSFTVDMQLYLRASTVRRLNRARESGQQLQFHTKLKIARDMLKAIEPLLPAGYQVYVLFDSWYASARFIKWCRKRNWHILCRLKSNRNLDGVAVKLHHQRLKHQRYTRVRVPAADKTDPRRYLVRSITGKLNGLPGTVRVFISKRHPEDKRPRYFLCTDLSLSAAQALTFYHHRWGCEVANWYIAERLGWADSRLWRFESTYKYLMVLWLALAFLECQKARGQPHDNLADVIRAHRRRHARKLVEAACALALTLGNIAPVLARFTVAA